MRADYVKVTLLCDRCRAALDLCVPVERNVPRPLSCSPGVPVGGGGGSAAGAESPRMACAVCGLSWHMDSSLLMERVNDATRGGWGEHIRNDAVVLHCPAS